ncbi:hypothetical protein PVA45_02955 [Entomospira entomophila]|uniref:Uncharacterized protein n=1 Tax=Entomospira entomophila TaxID=2719988 RepID=A0A968GDL2_9SPIO|nr:hypothetical protein [Entomospira entomophilus]NIZ40474.1 hypothetical protein [Entomospira entomophilus]WDI36032.1 hypothetical protein PVA45_02955 [Entomospira entomophilus]
MKTEYTTFYNAPIRGVTLFNFEDLTMESRFLQQLASQSALSKEQRQWLWSIYEGGTLAEYRWLDTPEVFEEHSNFIIVNDEYVVYSSGISASYDHITVVPKEEFVFPFFMYQ